MYDNEQDFDEKIGFTAFFWIGSDLNERTSFANLKNNRRI